MSRRVAVLCLGFDQERATSRAGVTIGHRFFRVERARITNLNSESERRGCRIQAMGTTRCRNANT